MATRRGPDRDIPGSAELSFSFTERLWRNVKYEEVYLKEYTTLKEAEAGIAAYFAFYNATRPHQALAYQTPQQVHFALARSLPRLY